MAYGNVPASRERNGGRNVEPLDLKLLGRPEVVRGGSPLEFRSRREQGLLFYLVAEGGPQTREKLAELLWPSGNEKKGRAALRNALSGLRHTLRASAGASGAGSPDALPDGAAYLLAGRGSAVAFDPTPGANLDLDVLETASEMAWPPADGPAGHEERRRALEASKAAVAAYRGEFLEGFSLDDAPGFEYWMGLEREAWRRRAETAFDRLTRLEMDAGEAREAAAVARRWVGHAPLGEAAYLRLMEACLAAGDAAGALRGFEEGSRALKEGLGAEPGPEMKALAARVRAEGSLRTSPAARGGELSGGTRSRVPEPPLIGRSSEFGALIADYHAVRAAGARAVVIAGDPGLGKTRLVAEFLHWARSEGADALTGAAFGSGGELAYGPLVSAIRPRIERERAPDDLLPDVWISELSRLLPEIRDRYPDLPAPGGDEAPARGRLFEALALVVEALADRSHPEPLVVFLDDLQWSDAATLDALRYGSRRWAEDGSRVLLIVATHGFALEQRPELSEALSDLSRDLPVRRLTVGRLTGEDAVQLLRSIVAEVREDHRGPNEAADLERLGRKLHAETGGHPLLITQIVTSLAEKGVLLRGEGPNDGWSLGAVGDDDLRVLIAPDVRATILAYIGRLDTDASNLLAAGAVLGHGFGFEQLRELAGIDEDEGLAALAKVLRSHLLQEGTRDSPAGDASEGDAYTFAHDLVRDLVYTEAGSARRRVYHRRALTMLEEEGAPPAELARHALASGLHGEAFPHLVAAGDEAMAAFAASDATRHYEQARRLLGRLRDRGGGRDAGRRPPPPAEVERLYLNLARSYELNDREEEARSVREELRRYGR